MLPIQEKLQNSVRSVAYLLKWSSLSILLGVIVGSACAFFLGSLEFVTNVRFQHPWLLYWLPLAGAGIVWMYGTFGKAVEAGNNLIMEEIHEPRAGVPFRMAPFVLLGTLITHLCGGSAGREGTAVQMGGSLASWLAKTLPGFHQEDVRNILLAGVAAGFGGVFGTPVTGMIFAVEFLTIGRINFAASLPCLLASIISDQTCMAWGIGHTHYKIASVLTADSGLHLAPFDIWTLCCAAIAGIVFGWASWLFASMTHGLHSCFKRFVAYPIFRPILGGIVVIGCTLILGTRDYLGLGVTSPDADAVTIVSCFNEGGANPLSWFWKSLFTSITLSSGFKGGEVTPLFFIGASLGNTLATLQNLPIDLFAALGFLAVFAGATNTPIACTVMGVELFGGENIVYFSVACLMSYLSSGHAGIYSSQRIGTEKMSTAEMASQPLHTLIPLSPVTTEEVSSSEVASYKDQVQ